VRLRFRIRPPVSARAYSVERTVEVEAGRGAVTLGREAGSDIELPFGTVSARHARLVRAADVWAVTDAGSANGTFLGDERLRAGEPQVLREGQSFRLADVELVFEGASASEGEAATPESTATLARRLVSDLFGSCRPAEVARLVVEGGPEQGKELVLAVAGQSYRVGRARDCDLVLEDDDVSREHASFQRTWSGVEVQDLGSKNGVEVEGVRVDGVGRMRDGEAVLVGGITLRLDDPEDRYLREMQQEPKRSATTPMAAQEGVPVPVAAPEPERRRRRRGPNQLGPAAVAAVALAVLVSIGGLVLWLLVGT
jgi:pSer/pThr/pTyr-binding forkhead associated (FHA) protein